MKKLLLVIVVVALALMLVVPLAVAKPGGGMKHGHYKFTVVGKVAPAPEATAAAEAPVDTLYVTVRAGSHIKGLRTTDAPFIVAGDARIRLLTGDGQVVKTFADIAPGDWVKARGTLTVEKADGKVVSRTYTIKNLKYKDLTPDEVVPTVTP